MTIRRPISVLSVVGLAAIAGADPVPSVAPSAVPGKEYSNFRDHSMAAGFPFVPGQTLAWDGLGGAIDGLNYSPGFPGLAIEVDAMAAFADRFFNEVTNDQVTMLASVTTSGSIAYNAATHHGGSHGALPNVGLWAAPLPQINTRRPPNDVDGLEVWGTPTAAQPFDANMFSIERDIGASVYAWDQTTSTATAYISQAQIAAAIGNPDLARLIDVDALMVNDLTNLREWELGDEIMFSIAPIISAAGVTIYDGGEIWVWSFGGPATFLFHGGETWDTLHDVTGHFAHLGMRNENINALEAVPTPGSLALLALGGLIAARRRRLPHSP